MKRFRTEFHPVLSQPFIEELKCQLVVRTSRSNRAFTGWENDAEIWIREGSLWNQHREEKWDIFLELWLTLFVYFLDRSVDVFFHYRNDVCMWDWGTSKVVLSGVAFGLEVLKWWLCICSAVSMAHMTLCCCRSNFLFIWEQIKCLWYWQGSKKKQSLISEGFLVSLTDHSNIFLLT